MAPKRRKTRAASRATASTVSQESMCSESLLTTHIGSPVAASSPQKDQNRAKATAEAIFQTLTSKIQQAYSNMSLKFNDIFSSLRKNVSEDQMDMLYTSIYDKIETAHSTFRENFQEAITGKQSSFSYTRKERVRDSKINKSRRSRSEERNEEPKTDIQRSRSRNHLEIPQTQYGSTSRLSEYASVTYVLENTQRSARVGSSYKLAAVTPVLRKTGKPIVYRKPLEGEHVISMAGSPILVAVDRNQNKAEVHIQAKDGKVYAIAPGCLENVTDFPGVDPKQLESIKKIQLLLEKQSCN